MNALKNTIEQYWTRRASSYTEVVRKNLADGWDGKWADELIRNFPKVEDRTLRVLDIGTGPGFYAIILAARGYDVTAVDVSGATPASLPKGYAFSRWTRRSSISPTMSLTLSSREI